MSKKNLVEIPRAEYIDMLANKSNLINFSNHNSKTGVACLNLAFPVVVCRPDAPCKSTCYACKGRQQMCTVQGAYFRNLRIYHDDPDDFFAQMLFTIKHSGLPKVRLFDSGDFPDAEFLIRLVDLCKKTPDVKYMAFTKKYELVNSYLDTVGGVLPANLNILFSAWDITWNVPNPYGLGVAYVDFNNKADNPDIPDTAFQCPGHDSTCSACGACWSKKLKAVVFKQH